MQKFALGIAAVAGLVHPALAADLRLPVKAPPPAPAWTFTGCYAGGNAGGL